VEHDSALVLGVGSQEAFDSCPSAALVTGKLNGKRVSFIIQHKGTMSKAFM